MDYHLFVLICGVVISIIMLVVAWLLFRFKEEDEHFSNRYDLPYGYDGKDIHDPILKTMAIGETRRVTSWYTITKEHRGYKVNFDLEQKGEQKQEGVQS